MKKLSLKIGFLLTAAETLFLGSLPANEPTAVLTSTQIRHISNIYYRVFGSHPKFEELIKIAIGKKWPGGERKKTVEAQRDILSMLADLRSMQPVMYEKPLDCLLGTIQLADPLQVAIAGAVLHLVETHEEEVTPDTIYIVVNGQMRQIKSNVNMSHEQLFRMAFPGDVKYSPTSRIIAKTPPCPPATAWSKFIVSGEGALNSVWLFPAMEICVSASTPVEE
jgi:CRP-like cAMP-binding protein